MIKKGKQIMVKSLYQSKDIVKNVYIHLPFCQRKCHFCAFPVHAIGGGETKEIVQFKERYVDNLVREISLSRRFMKLGQSVSTLYFGGGTPSLYSKDQLLRICKLFSLIKAEVSLELNPSEINKLTELKGSSINRFSIGMQTFDEDILAKMNRFCQTSPEKLQNVINQYRPSNLSLDFILDFCTKKTFFDQMINFIKKIEPEHVTLYMLDINDGSYLKKNLKEFKWLPKEASVINAYLRASEVLREMGYEHYQVSNFAKSSAMHSQHNQCYWEGNKQFLAFGMGATSLINGLRITRPPNLAKYYRFVDQIQKKDWIEADILGIESYEEKIQIKLIQSILVSGLRCEKGVSWTKVQQISQDNFPQIRQTIIKVLKQIQGEQADLIKWSQMSQKIALTVPKGYLLTDEITFRIITTLQKQLK